MPKGSGRAGPVENLHPPKRMGRPKGSVNKASASIAERARAMLERPEYLAALRERLDKGQAPHMETLYAHYGYGKPKDIVEATIKNLNTLKEIDNLSDADLQDLLKRVRAESNMRGESMAEAG